MKRSLLLLFCGLLSWNFSLAQRPHAPATLLWRISHPSAAQPSYLFGTMHLQDKRLFHFTDSLYQAIQVVNGFAAELDLDDLNEVMISAIQQRTPVSKNASILLNDVINSSLKKKYKHDLEKKFRKKFEKIELAELSNEAENWQSVYRKSDDMPTFVDAYLYGLAQQQEKWTGALEDPEDQLQIGTDDLEIKIQTALLSDQNRRQHIDTLVDIYLSEDLDRMHEMVKQPENNFGYFRVNIRNIKMAQRIDSLMAVRTCFYAVGAAHLPGDSGLIQLLRKQGYSVEPVVSHTRLHPDEMLSKDRKLNWQKTSLSNGDFFIDMPGKASSLGENTVFQDAKLYFDPLTMSGFFSAFLPLWQLTEKAIDSTCRELRKNYAKTGKVLRDSVWKMNDKKAYQVEAITKDGFVNMLAHPVPGGIVLNMIVSMSEAGMKLNRATEYFSSFVVNKTPTPPMTPGWRREFDAKMQFSYEVPVNLEPVNQANADTSWSFDARGGYDAATGVYYLVNTMESKKGYYSSSDLPYFEDVVEVQRAQKENRVLNYKFVTTDGFPTLKLLLAKKVDRDSIYYDFTVINRGNRRYLTVVGYKPRTKAAADATRFTNSIKLIPYAHYKTIAALPNVENFTLESPTRFELDSSITGEDSRRYLSYDPSSSVTSHIDMAKINRYYGSITDSAMMQEQVEQYCATGDSIIQLNLFYQQKYPVAEGWIQLATSHNRKRFKILVSGDTVFSLITVVSAEVEQAASYKKMFNSFALKHPTPNSYGQSKAKDLLNDLLLPDTLIFREAKTALEWVTIEPKDIRYLQEATLHPMVDFSERSYCTHDVLLKRLVEMNDSSTYGFIEAAYPQLTERNTELQYPLLSALIKMNTGRGRSLALSLLKTGLPKQGSASIFYDALADSIAYVSEFYPFIWQHRQDSILRKVIPGMVYDMNAAGTLSKEQLLAIKPVLLSLADEYAGVHKDKQLPLPVYYGSLIHLLIQFGGEEGKVQLDSLALHPNEDIQFNTVFRQLEIGSKPLSAAVQQLAADPYYRARIYELLQEAKLLKLYPSSLRSQRYLAASHLFRTIWEDYRNFDMQFLREKTVKIQGKKQQFFLYKISFTTDEGQVEFLGVAGGYLNKKTLQANPGKFVGVWYDEPFDASMVDVLFERYLETQH